MFTWAVGALEWDTAEYSPLFIWTSPKIFTSNRFRCDMFFFAICFLVSSSLKINVVLDWRQVNKQKTTKNWKFLNFSKYKFSHIIEWPWETDDRWRIFQFFFFCLIMHFSFRWIIILNLFIIFNKFHFGATGHKIQYHFNKFIVIRKIFKSKFNKHLFKDVCIMQKHIWSLSKSVNNYLNISYSVKMYSDVPENICYGHKFSFLELILIINICLY